MDDLDEIRAALGYRTFDVYGTSYGATAAQVFLKRHPASVRAMVLDGGTLIDIPFEARFARNGERALQLLAARCAADRACAKAFPRWRSQLTELMRRWDAKPVDVRKGVKVDGGGLAGVVQTMTLDATTAASVPLAIETAAAGDYATLRNYVSTSGPTRSLMFWNIWCNEPWVGLDARGPWHTYLDGYLNSALAQYRMVCKFMPKRDEPAADWRRPRSSVPLLALVGGADPQDPIGNLAGLTKAMPNARALVVPAQGHTVGQYGCIGELVARFVERRSAKGLDTSCVRAITPAAFKLR